MQICKKLKKKTKFQNNEFKSQKSELRKRDFKIEHLSTRVNAFKNKVIFAQFQDKRKTFIFSFLIQFM